MAVQYEGVMDLTMIGVGGLVAGGVNYFVNKEANKVVSGSSTTSGSAVTYEIPFIHNYPYLTGLLVAVVGIVLLYIPGLSDNEYIGGFSVGLLGGGLAVAVAALAKDITL